MNRSGLQRLIPIILVLIIVIVAIAALVSLGRTLFSGDESTSPTPIVGVPKETPQDALKSTLADRSVRMTVRGPIVADEKFHSYRITASPNSRNMTTYVGYLKTEVTNEQLENNIPAYEQFVNALSRADLMEGTPLTGDANDTRGACATGTVYEFEVRQGNNTIQKLWTSTCKSTPGSLKASLVTVRRLFQLQIPDYSKLLSAINFSN
jgi:hypothetical protein